ncbi:hypothetical protein G9C85_01960 [Halorubellus sp. JP-L1]|uniref:hypothetical protein n=1 Tax=Halorubellus sp. JP-L1 TaxID=2715753 RepID=UPI0014084DF5|nr:hypothetical protein [Halorubellus sp. JP-L1]NHN40402.1 hypothetical protein [Halorubellus sp. JP-L1]
MTCPFLEYRSASGDRSFDVARAYCTAASAFVQPMRADICNDRYDLQHDRDCEIYREHADEATAGKAAGGAEEPTVDADEDA